MKKLFFLIFVCQLCMGQQAVEVIKNANWEAQKLDKNIVWKKIHFKQKELFEGNQSINIIEVRLKNRKVKFGFATADSLKIDHKTKRILTKTSELAANNNALVAINGGFFDTKNGGSVDFLEIGGKVIDTVRLAKSFHSQAGIVIHKNKVSIIKGENRIGWEQSLLQENVLVTGPLLLHNNQIEGLPKNAFNDNRHPRTCACVTNNKKLLLITVDGRSAESFGMTLNELSTLAIALNCKDAINLDGGGSTTMYIKGQPEKGVVNYPSDNKIFDHAGERPVANILFVK